MASVGDVLRIEQFLERGERSHDNRRGCLQLIAKVRIWLSSGKESAEVRRKLEQIIARFGNARF